MSVSAHREPSTPGAGPWDGLAGSYTVDPDRTRVGFAVRHAMVSTVRGRFEVIEGSAVLEPDLDASSAWARLDATSLTTHNARRDAYLHEADVLALERFPEITFASTAVRPRAERSLEVTGDLTIRGVTRSVTVPFDLQGSATEPSGGLRVGFTGSVVVDRLDFGIRWNAALEAGGVLVGEDVSLELEVSAVRRR